MTRLAKLLFLPLLLYGFIACQEADTDEIFVETEEIVLEDSILEDSVDEDSFTKDSLAVFVNDTISFLALGDSYTIGQGVAAKDRWPSILAQQLQDRGTHIVDLQIIAQSGWTTRNLKSAINSVNPKPPFQLVSLLIGVNNQYQGGSLTTFENEFTELLDIAIKLAGGNKKIVFVLSIPDYGLTPFGQRSGGASISMQIDKFNAVISHHCQLKSIDFYDITHITRTRTGSEFYVSDQLHPSAKMYSLWVDHIYQSIENRLK
ncbi:MAG: SGNH/GDSL hydrolase family protein [Cyclobacteriaceae bacterium]